MRCFASAQNGKNRHLLHCFGPETCGSRNAPHPHFHVLNHPVLSRNALLPLLYPSVRFDQIIMDRCFRLTCVCHQTCFARLDLKCEFHAFCPSRSSATRIRPHRCLKKHCHVVICQRRIGLLGSLQSLVSTLHRSGPSVSSCSGTLHDLPLCSSNTFSDRRLSLSQTM